MTMPHLMNCSHLDDGWCLQCVGELQTKLELVEEAINLVEEGLNLQHSSLDEIERLRRNIVFRSYIESIVRSIREALK